MNTASDFGDFQFSLFLVKTEGSDDCADAKYLKVTIFLAHRKFVNYCTFR